MPPNPNDVMPLLQRAMAAHQRQNFAEAEAGYRRILALDGRQFEALHFLGVLVAQTGRPDEACELIGKSLAIDASKAEAFGNYARVLKEAKRYAEAVANADKALAINPRFIPAMFERGNALMGLGRFEEALAAADQVLAINAMSPEALSNRGLALAALGRHEEALATYDRVLATNPKFFQAMLNRCASLMEMGLINDAIAGYDSVLAIAPRDEQTIVNRGFALKLIDDLAGAVAAFERALALNPNLPGVHYQLGLAAVENGQRERAISHLRRALELAPDFAEARFDLCTAELPLLYMSEAEIGERRTAYRDALTALREEYDSKWSSKPARIPGTLQPFLLPYQGRNDRELQQIRGELVCKVMARMFPPGPLPPLAEPGEPIRVGFVSRFFEDHTVWKILTRGWLTQLDREKFRLFGYSTAPRQEGAEAEPVCERFVRGPLSLELWQDEIRRDAPHVLIYPEIGIDPVCGFLAALRLAPVQCTSFGHPETTGYPTVDYFLSSDLMEPPDADDHYTERLVRLPNLMNYYEPPELHPVSLTRADFGIRPDATVYFCGQSLFKYLPQYDEVFPRIAQQVKDCQFAFIDYQRGGTAGAQFWLRLERAFAASGLKTSDHCVKLRRMDTSEFIAAAGLCDVVLDSFAWSGYNTTLEIMAHDLPYVTMPGEFMRGRHTAAAMNMIGVTETVAKSVDDYVAIAVRLANDRPWRDAIKQKLAAGKRRVFRDRATVAGLEEWLEKVARRPAG